MSIGNIINGYATCAAGWSALFGGQVLYLNLEYLGIELRRVTNILSRIFQI